MIILNSSCNPELTTQSEDPKLGHDCSDFFGWEFAQSSGNSDGDVFGGLLFDLPYSLVRYCVVECFSLL